MGDTYKSISCLYGRSLGDLIICFDCIKKGALESLLGALQNNLLTGRSLLGCENLEKWIFHFDPFLVLLLRSLALQNQSSGVQLTLGLLSHYLAYFTNSYFLPF